MSESETPQALKRVGLVETFPAWSEGGGEPMVREKEENTVT